MQIVGRYHRVRPIGPRGIGAPYVWDRGRAQDAPRMIPAPYDRGERYKGFTRYGEWWRSPDGIWMPALSGGALTARQLPPVTWGLHTSHPSNSTLALDSAYTYNSAGDAIGVRFRLGATLTLQDVYYYISSYTGTAANVNDISLELRDNSFTVGPGSTLTESKTSDPASATGWIKSTGWTSSCAGDTPLWMVIGDADGGGTDFATVLRFSAYGLFNQRMFHGAFHTTDGWASVRTAGSTTAAIVLAFTDGSTSGNPMGGGLSTSTSSTNQRGLRFVAPAAVKLFALLDANDQVAVATRTGINLWSGTDGPGGSPAASGAVDALQDNAITATATQGFAFATPPSLTQGTTYRLVFTYGAASTAPRRVLIGTGADAALRSAMLGGGAWYWAEASGTSDWSLDNTSEFPNASVVVEDFVSMAPATYMAGV